MLDAIEQCPEIIRSPGRVPASGKSHPDQIGSTLANTWNGHRGRRRGQQGPRVIEFEPRALIAALADVADERATAAVASNLSADSGVRWRACIRMEARPSRPAATASKMAGCCRAARATAMRLQATSSVMRNSPTQ